MSISRGDVRKLYRALLRHSSRFADYNFREYALRRTREDFRAAAKETDPTTVKKLYYNGLNNLTIVKRQASISQMFANEPVVLEKQAGRIAHP